MLAFGVHKPQGIALKRYLAHYVSKASWFGARILAGTISPESPTLVDLFLTLFSVPGTSGPHATMIAPASDLFAKTQGVSEEAFGFFMDYAVHVLNNMGNFKSFGDTKFIPRLSPTDFEKILKASARSVEVLPLFAKVKDVIYTSDPEASLLIGYPADHHVSGYYDGPVSKDDVDFVQGFLNKQAISELNTRLFKKEDGSFEVWIASAEKSGPKTHTYEGKTIHVSKGDFAREMSAITENMAAALPFVANENQKNMVTAYVESFKTGSIDAHKESQRHWIRDVGPVVETNIGFIETYRDPAGVRAEWEGFVAVVNKEMTKKFEALVNGASAFIARLPWPKEFEKDSFLKPDFTSLEVLTFATSGSPPAGM